jgi:hypothetical protein
MTSSEARVFNFVLRSPTLPHPKPEFSASMLRSPTLPHPKPEFSASTTSDGPDAPRGLCSKIGGIWPIPLWGLSSLKYLHQCSNLSRASSRLMNRCAFKHSACNSLLNPSIKALSVGLRSNSAWIGPRMAGIDPHSNNNLTTNRAIGDAFESWIRMGNWARRSATPRFRPRVPKLCSRLHPISQRLER